MIFLTVKKIRSKSTASFLTPTIAIEVCLPPECYEIVTPP